jgi:hypothetical protein
MKLIGLLLYDIETSINHQRHGDTKAAMAARIRIRAPFCGRALSGAFMTGPSPPDAPGF